MKSMFPSAHTLVRTKRRAVFIAVAGASILSLSLFIPHLAWTQNVSPGLEIVHPSDDDNVRAGGTVKVVAVVRGADLEGADVTFPVGPQPIDTQISQKTIVATFEIPDEPGNKLTFGVLAQKTGDPLVFFEKVTVNIVD